MQPDVPHVGVGIDSYTAAQIVDGAQMQDLFGLYGAAIVDAETYGSADAARTVNVSNAKMNILMRSAGEDIRVSTHHVGDCNLA